jgi:hypothetical protein
MWNREAFYTNRITDNTVNSEMLMSRWDTLSHDVQNDMSVYVGFIYISLWLAFFRF